MDINRRLSILTIVGVGLIIWVLIWFVEVMSK